MDAWAVTTARTVTGTGAAQPADAGPAAAISWSPAARSAPTYDRRRGSGHPGDHAREGRPTSLVGQ